MVRLRPMVAPLVVFALLAACASADPGDDGGSGPTTTAGLPVEDVVLPDPPAPMTLTGTPAEQTAALADALAPRNDDRPAALLAAFGRGGIPVVDADERSLTTAGDTIGVPWAFVYTVGAVPTPEARVPLSEVARVFTADGVEPAFDTATVAAELVSGLRDALAGDPNVPGPTPIALLVQEEARRARGVDLADPAVTADEIVVSAGTAALLVSAGILTIVVRTTDRARSASAPTQQKLPAGCATDSAGQWALWIVSKVAAGTSIPGINWDGVFREVINHIADAHPPDKIPADLAALKNGLGKAGTIAGLAAAALTIMTTYAGFLTAGADIRLKKGEPLVRTKSATADGKDDQIVVKVGFDYGRLGSKTVDAMNCLLSMLAALGNNATLASPGPVPEGVKVTIEGLEGFGQALDTGGAYVLLHTPLSKETDSTGTVEFTVVGKHQRNQIAESAPPFDRWFTVNVQAQHEPTNAETLTKLFLDSFLSAGGGIVGGTGFIACVDPVADIAKQMQWDMGSKRFRLVDWIADLRVDGTVFNNRWQATKCGGMAGEWVFTITNSRDRPTGTTVIVDRDVAFGDPPVHVQTDPIEFYDPNAETEYFESSLLTFYGDGSDTAWGAPTGMPALGIDEAFGGTGIPIEVGQFC